MKNKRLESKEKQLKRDEVTNTLRNSLYAKKINTTSKKRDGDTTYLHYENQIKNFFCNEIKDDEFEILDTILHMIHKSYVYNQEVINIVWIYIQNPRQYHDINADTKEFLLTLSLQLMEIEQSDLNDAIKLQQKKLKKLKG